MRIERQPDRDALQQVLADALCGATTDALAARGEAWFALAGGSTPLPAYERWAIQPCDWSQVHIVPTDERQVDAASPHSNLAAFARALLPAQGVQLHGLVDVEGVFAHTPHLPDGAFDLVLLGMGTDGHFASIFPAGDNMREALADDAPAVIATRPDPLPAEAPHARATLSLPRLLDTRELLLAISGQEKLDVLLAAHERELPIARLLDAAGDRLAIHWSP